MSAWRPCLQGASREERLSEAAGRAGRWPPGTGASPARVLSCVGDAGWGLVSASQGRAAGRSSQVRGQGSCGAGATWGISFWGQGLSRAGSPALMGQAQLEGRGWPPCWGRPTPPGCPAVPAEAGISAAVRGRASVARDRGAPNGRGFAPARSRPLGPAGGTPLGTLEESTCSRSPP